MSSSQSGPIHQTVPPYPSGGGNGVSPPFFFSRSGNNPVGTYLKIGDVITSNSGQIIVGNNTAVKIVASNYNLLATTTRIQFVERTARTTWADVSGLYIDIPSGNYTATRTGISVTITANCELGCYVYSGSNMNDTVVGLYVIPA